MRTKRSTRKSSSTKPKLSTRSATRTKKRQPKRTPLERPDNDAWHDAVTSALKAAIGDNDALVLVDSIDGAPPRVVVSLAIAAPPGLVPTLRKHKLLADIVAKIREEVARVLLNVAPDCALAVRLVAAAIETTPEMLSLALDVAGRSDVAAALELPPSPLQDEPDDEEPGRPFVVTKLRIDQIAATGQRRMRIMFGRELPPDAESLDDPRTDAPPTRTTRDGIAHARQTAATTRPMHTANGPLAFLPALTLTHDTAKPRFWLIAQLGNVVSVRKAQRMRGLAETRYTRASEAAACKEFDRRVAEKLATGWTRMDDDLETALLHHEPVLPEMPREIQREAARTLLASRSWRHTLAAQALVKALRASHDAGDRDLARTLVARIATHR